MVEAHDVEVILLELLDGCIRSHYVSDIVFSRNCALEQRVPRSVVIQEEDFHFPTLMFWTAARTFHPRYAARRTHTHFLVEGRC